jgi:hypothetical protein
MPRGVVPLDPRLNPGFLKLDLLCRGARLVGGEAVEGAGGRPVVRTRAGLGSGLELVLEDDLWVNVPVVEAFARASPYEVRIDPSGRSTGVEILRDGAPCARARLAPRPAWYDATTGAGRPMRRVGTLQGTYLAIYPGRVCEFWVPGPQRASRESCRFCSVGLNLGADDAEGKTVDEVLEVVHAARRESGITYVDFNAGHADDFGFLDAIEPYVTRVKRETGLLVGVQVPPHPDLSRWERLRSLGVNRVSFCFELFDPATFREVCPGKARVYGLDHYLETAAYCASLGARGRRALEPWVVNGELIAGLEPADRSVEAVRWLAKRGVVPTVCVFRPLVGTALADRPSPATEEVLPVFQALHEACVRHDLPVGIAPGIHVSLVLLPEEARWLVQDEAVAAAWDRRTGRRALARGAFHAWLSGRAAWRGIRSRPARTAVAPVR